MTTELAAVPVSLKRNVAANYLGQGWRAVMALAFVPVYVKYVGIEAYGLIGIFAIVQAWMTLFDMGMRPALTREMARFTAGVLDVQSIQNLLRSIEVLVFLLAGAAALTIWAFSGWVARSWLTAQQLDTNTVARAFAVIGLVTALRFIETIYVGALSGLQRQVLENTMSSIMATVRGVGAVAVLAWVSPTITAFFLWQALVSLVTVLVLAAITHRVLPRPPQKARFSRASLEGIRRFATGMMLITVLSLLLTQADKMLLSRLLTLTAFGYYALAATVTSSMLLLAMPIASAFYPRFVELAAKEDDTLLRSSYHQAAQLVTVCAGTAAALLMAFGERILRAWSGDATLATQVAPLLLVLTLGGMLNILMMAPYYLQVAHGWTGLTVRVNAVAVAILVPAILLLVPRYGAIGAAWVWVALNTGYVLFAIRLMHRRLLRTEMGRWYLQDVAIPLAAAAVTAWLCRVLLPRDLSRMGELVLLVVAGGCIISVAGLAAPKVRQQIRLHLSGASFLRRPS